MADREEKRRRRKYKNLENKKNFLDEIKSIFEK